MADNHYTTREGRLNRGFALYGFLVALFACCLVSGNLVFQKFISLGYFGKTNVEFSVALFFFPVTFLISDLISEFFGKKAAESMVVIGFCCSIIVALTMCFADYLQATPWSPVNNEVFHLVFGNYSIAFLISICGWAFSQLIDIRIYLFLKKLTKGRILWLRNVASLWVAQALDTCLVIGILGAVGIVPADQIFPLVRSGFLFKATFSLCCVPIYYALIALVRYWLDEQQP